MQSDETIEQAAKRYHVWRGWYDDNFACTYRELNEECNITVNSLEEVGIITFEFINDPPLLEVHLFKSETFSGEPAETEGMKFLPLH